MTQAFEYVRCMICGTTRPLEIFGLDENGYPVDDPPAYESQLLVKHVGGRARIHWVHLDLPRHVAEALRDRLRAQLARLEEALGDGD